MPVYRGPDGKIIEERTTRVGKDKQHGYSEPDTQQVGGSSPQDVAHASALPIDSDTEVVGKPKSTEGASLTQQSSADSGDKTMIYRPNKSSKSESVDRAAEAEEVDFMDDPLAGWLVVVDGPGKGASLNLGYGSNSIGRGKNERVCVDFGDKLISRNGHATLTYDPRGKRFFIQGGGGANLTYIADEVVLAPRELKAYDKIIIGNTSLRFVPLCGADFDWQEESTEE